MGEGFGTQGWPEPSRLKAIWNKIKNASDLLETQRVKWAEELQEETDKNVKAAAQAKKKAEALAKRMQLSEEAAAASAERAEDLMQGGSEEGPPADEVFARMLERQAEDKAFRAQQNKKEKSMFSKIEAKVATKPKAAGGPDDEAKGVDAAKKPPEGKVESKAETAHEPEASEEKKKKPEASKLKGDKKKPGASEEKPAATAAEPEAEGEQSPVVEIEETDVYKGMLDAVVEAMEADELEKRQLAGIDEMFKNLSPDQQAKCEHIRKTKLGVCARCRYSSGCLSCDFNKAVAYFSKQPKGEPASKEVPASKGVPVSKVAAAV